MLILVFVVREAHIAKLKASNNHASDKVWEAILKRSLLLEKPSSDVIEETESLETVVDITSDGAMSLIFRRNIGELTVSVSQFIRAARSSFTVQSALVNTMGPEHH